MLAIVEYEQHCAIPQSVAEGVDQSLARLLAYPQDRGQDACHKRGVDERRQLHEPDPVGVSGLDIGCELERQTSLTDPTRTCRCQKARSAKQALGLGQVLLPSHQTAELHRQVVVSPFGGW